MSESGHVVPVIFGEVLFDCFPDGNSVLGGAPFNVAWHLQAFGLSPLVISSVGDDELGRKVKAAMQSRHMRTEGLQRDPLHPTGSVDIEFNQGEPNYSIVEHRAYDYIDASSLPSLPADKLLYHGSLALRNNASREALTVLKASNTGTVFMDVNLRDPWWEKQYVLQLADDADWVKLNEDELGQLGADNGDIQSRADTFLHEHRLSGLVVTLGEKGAIALTANGEYTEVKPVITQTVIDTVGAGDALTSVLILGLSHHWPLEQTMQRAQGFASMLVGQQGATVHNHDFYRAIVEDWGM
jgi:fructokinase